MKVNLVAGRYAKALFDLASETDELEAVNQDMTMLAQVCRENKDLIHVLKSPVISEEKKGKIMVDLFGERFHAMTLQFILILIRKNREYLIPEIAESFLESYKQFHHIITVHLTTAVPATDRIRKEVVDRMKAYTQLTIDLEEDIDPDIIGGFILNWNDMQYDASLRYQIDKLKRGSARVNLYKKGF